ncbi:Lrp/AsnC family transcriptional regulator [Arthrobacter sp. Marseille-P9274]|uniref:Lrp/AsnC family transcriptional regulator n=1 Tax=Arthrobacter sp. Marseille-P9274 TaxID=2866572 RepID=UPI0021C63F51|nr:Lrp/AsnC family transcriptional regulator [Arthrobacter sp. Marseille-P9274]
MPILDAVDAALLLHLLENPRAQIGDIAASLGIARNTVVSRMRRLERHEVVRSSGRDVDLGVLGFNVLAFITLEVSHRELDAVVSALRSLEQVLEVHEISGRGDVWCRIAARETHDLHRVLRQILRIRGVIRTETSLALSEHIPYRVQPLLRTLAKAAPEDRTTAG